MKQCIELDCESDDSLAEQRQELAKAVTIEWPSKEKQQNQLDSISSPWARDMFRRGMDWLKANTKTVSADKLQEYIAALEAESTAAYDELSELCGIQTFREITDKRNNYGKARAARLAMRGLDET